MAGLQHDFLVVPAQPLPTDYHEQFASLERVVLHDDVIGYLFYDIGICSRPAQTS